MARLTTYDPARTKLVVGGIRIVGFAPGSMIEYTPDAPVIEDAEGVDSEPIRWARNNPYGTVKVSLAFSSEDNQSLSNFLNLDRLLLASIYPVVIEDDQTSLIAGSAWIKSQPTIEYNGDSPAKKVWEIRTLYMIHNIGGLSGDETILETLL